MERIVLFGGGPHCKCCIYIIEQEGKYEIAGITDPYLEIGSKIYGYPVIGRQEDIIQLISDYHIDAGLVSIGDNWIRNYVVDFIRSEINDFKFINAIHPSADIGTRSELGTGIVISAGCLVDTGCRIGNFCYFGTGGQLGHDSIMDDYSSIVAGSVTGGNIKIGKHTAITLGVTIVDRVEIGSNTVIGSGSLILKDIPDNVMVYGNPAKIVRTREPGERFLKPGLRKFD